MTPTSGYSGTPLPRKLGIKPGAAVAVLGAGKDVDVDDLLDGCPDDVTIRRAARGTADVVLLFAGRRADLARRLGGAVRILAPEKAVLWIAWPKKASGVATDLGEADVRAAGLATGLVDVKICAIDATWSGLGFRRRRA